MPLRIRSVVSYTLPCALALAGWWWYVSRKRERIAGLDKEEGPLMGLLASPSEGSNGLVEKAHSRSRTGTDRLKVKDEAAAEQLVVAEVHVESVTPEISRPSTPASCPGSVAALLAKTAELGSASESEVASTYASAATPWEMPAAADLLTGREGSHVATTTLPADEVGSSAVAVGSSRAALSNAVRPEPEGGVSAEKLRVPLARDLPLDLAMEDLSSGDLPTEEGRAPSSPRVEVPPPSFPCLVPTTPAPLPGPETEGHSRPLENGLPEDMAESTNMEEIQRIAAGLVSKVISEARQEVLTESQGSDSIKEEEEEEEEEDGSERLSEPSSSTPTSNGRPCPVRDPVMRVQNLLQEGPSPTDHREPGSDEEGLMGALQSECTEEVNGCVAPPLRKVAEETSNGRRRTDSCPKRTASAPLETTLEATTPGLAKIQAEEGIARAEDSGCSTCQSEDGISSEDLAPNSAGFSSMVPASKEDLLDILRSEICARIGLGQGDKEGRGSMVEVGLPPLRPDACQEKDLDSSGHMTNNETEADQSGGSDVNSMDSVDSGCTLGAVEDQRSDGQATHLHSSQLVIWEIEVPKHLVGRLIGKQGRYVSFLKQSSGAKIYISTLPYTQEFQICHIEGTQQQVDRALALIGKKFKDLDLTNLYCPPHLPITLPSLPMTTWLLLPNRVPVEVIVVNVVSAAHVFVQQHTHPTFHALRSLDQQMFLCYSQPGAPALPSPVEAGVVCAAPGVEGAWWRAQVISYYKDSGEVEIRYVDYGGYDRVKVDTLRQIRSDFVTLPFQGAEVLLDNIALLPGSDQFSTEANSILEEMTRGLGLLAQVTNYDDTTGLPLVQMWSVVGEELVSVNRSLAERGFGTWVDSF